MMIVKSQNLVGCSIPFFAVRSHMSVPLPINRLCYIVDDSEQLYNFLFFVKTKTWENIGWLFIRFLLKLLTWISTNLYNKPCHYSSNISD